MNFEDYLPPIDWEKARQALIPIWRTLEGQFMADFDDLWLSTHAVTWHFVHDGRKVTLHYLSAESGIPTAQANEEVTP